VLIAKAKSDVYISKSAERLRSYSDLTVFKMAAVRHLRFLKINFLTARAIKRPILHRLIKFRADQRNFADFFSQSFDWLETKPNMTNLDNTKTK